MAGFAADDADTISRRMAELAKEREDNKCTCLYEHGILVAASATCPVHKPQQIVDEVSGAHWDFVAEGHRVDGASAYGILEEEGYRLTGKRDDEG